MRGRRLAFDYGDVRIGVAACDADAILVSPLKVLQAHSKTLLAEISAIIAEVQPIRIYVGLPVNMSGTSGDSAEKATNFAKVLFEEFAVEVLMIDERLSTVSAQRKLKDAGISTRESKTLIDAMAAVAILEQGLASETR
ncbi:MAG: Holliday junction resolvase RuvX [Actinobacteria bacterium]|nr:Holliday junction resolvase RuvX [Actinomycetota bacterium]